MQICNVIILKNVGISKCLLCCLLCVKSAWCLVALKASLQSHHMKKFSMYV